MAKYGRESDASYGVTTRTPLGRVRRGCHDLSFKAELEPMLEMLFLGEVQPAFSFSTAPATGVLAPGLQPSHFLLDLNFAIWHVPALRWPPDAKMSLCHLVLPPHQANGSPDQRPPAALFVSSACLAQCPAPSGRSGFDGTFVDEEGGSRGLNLPNRWISTCRWC